MMKVRTNIVCFTLSASMMMMGLTGCENLNNTQNGALFGTLSGAGLGAIIGNQTGKKKEGALIGGVLGGLGGSMIGNNQDIREEHDAAHRQVAYERNQRRVEAKRMMNKEVIEMSQNGISDQTIIQAIHNNGVEFRGTSDEIIWMQQKGVSGTVISEMQKYQTR